MKKHLLIISIFLMGSLSAFANHVNRQTALLNARTYMTAHGIPVSIVEPAETSKTIKMDKKFGDRLHLFDIENGGFIVVSGDDTFPVVLGYSMNKMYRCENMPNEVIAILQKYSDEIKSYQKGGVSIIKQTSHASIKPLMITTWGQDEPYNSSCPDFIEKGKSLTGCVATAMAQLLYFHHCDSHCVSATIADMEEYDGQIDWGGYGPVHVDAVPKNSLIDWKTMQKSYDSNSTVGQKKAVSNLMLYCAASLKTSFADYQNGGSIASLYDVPDALKKYFDYSRGTRFVKRSYYSNEAEWDSVLYTELASGRPVMMQGQSKTGGHVFVTDGYADGLYHINWGWKGGANGYFIMTALTSAPSKNDMEAVINAVPNDGTFSENPVLTIKDFTIETKPVEHYDNGYPCEYKINVTSRMANAYSFDIALGVFNEKDELIRTSNVLSTAKNVTSITTGSVGGTAVLDVPVGNYTVFAVCRVNGTENWSKCNASNCYKMLAESNRASYSK